MHFHNSTAFSWVPGEAKCLGGEQQAPKSPRLQLHTMGAPSCVPHTVSPRLHDVPLGYTLTLGMSHWADTILDVVPPFTDICGQSTMGEKNINVEQRLKVCGIFSLFLASVGSFTILSLFGKMSAINTLRSDALRSASSVIHENKNLVNVRKRICLSSCRLVIHPTFQMWGAAHYWHVQWNLLGRDLLSTRALQSLRQVDVEMDYAACLCSPTAQLALFSIFMTPPAFHRLKTSG